MVIFGFWFVDFDWCCEIVSFCFFLFEFCDVNVGSLNFGFVFMLYCYMLWGYVLVFSLLLWKYWRILCVSVFGFRVWIFLWIFLKISFEIVFWGKLLLLNLVLCVVFMVIFGFLFVDFDVLVLEMVWDCNFWYSFLFKLCDVNVGWVCCEKYEFWFVFVLYCFMLWGYWFLLWCVWI